MSKLQLILGTLLIVAALGFQFQQAYAQSCLDSREAESFMQSIGVLWESWEDAKHTVSVRRTIYLGFVASTVTCLATAKSRTVCASLIAATKAALVSLDAARSDERRAYRALRAEQRAFDRWVAENC